MSKKCGGSVLGSENMIICIYLKMHFGLITNYLQNFCSPKKLKYFFYPTSFCSKTDILKNVLTVFAHIVKASGVQNNFHCKNKILFCVTQTVKFWNDTRVHK